MDVAATRDTSPVAPAVLERRRLTRAIFHRQLASGFVNRPNVVVLRSVEDLADAREFRAVISAALAAAPMDRAALRRAVRSFVDNEREAGGSPAQVITRLTDLVEGAVIVPMSARLALTRRRILWGVDDYFGGSGGEILAPDSPHAP